MPALDATSLVVGITGHRNLDASTIPALKAQLRTFFVNLAARYPHLPVVLLSSLAVGSDQLAAEVALELGLRVVAPLPLPVTLYRADFESPDSLAVFKRQLQSAEVLELPLRRGVGVDEASRPGPARPGARSSVRPGRHLRFQPLPCATTTPRTPRSCAIRTSSIASPAQN